MPLFMDRHDIPGVTAEQVAELHVLDLRVAAKHAVEFLTYWFDASAGSAFCLARAASAEEMTAVHRESHGMIPNEISPVVESDVLRFLGTITDPAILPRLEPMGLILRQLDLAGVDAFVAEERKRWTEYTRVAGIQPE